MAYEELLQRLRERGLVKLIQPQITPLAGGVSSEILLIEEDKRRFVLKRALAKLKVKDDWFADVSRNSHEQAFMRYVGRFLPDAVPRVLENDPEHGFFLMEYLGQVDTNWKTLLLKGQADPQHAVTAARIMGQVHKHSWNDPAAKEQFDTTENFTQLRIEPYLLTTGQRHPKLKKLFDTEAQRLAETRLCLVHGDFSPKNILIHRFRMVLLDCEVAWFGDPAFDLAFLFNHFMLKALLHHDKPQPLLALATKFWETYRPYPPTDADGLLRRTLRLLLMLMLARVDGKSPVEYLAEDHQKQIVRDFVYEQLPKPPAELGQFIEAWEQAIKK